eukprot:893141-Pelagomonas_calceolata.AAC.7
MGHVHRSVPCSQEMLTIVAMLTAAPHGPWVAPPGVRKALDEAKSRYAHGLVRIHLKEDLHSQCKQQAHPSFVIVSLYLWTCIIL